MILTLISAEIIRPLGKQQEMNQQLWLLKNTSQGPASKMSEIKNYITVNSISLGFELMIAQNKQFEAADDYFHYQLICGLFFNLLII